MDFVLLSVGGVCGAIARYQIGAAFSKRKNHTFPFGTFFINLSGAFLLGIFCGLGISGNSYLLLGDGFCGAFTTFSTFTVESVQLMQHDAVRESLLFIVLSLAAGLLCFSMGYTTGKLF
ncbi:fluoride efflux transporter CrcB [Caproiciproducens sp. CPB-2]|uniref:fluoride efflux transporter CrcB n=1 Tax=unclassified Caproiciproducens TaxID=2643836 RepID=UPI0023DC65A9|nr:fluoride efflux transporter CrcB [Caproiciproducens sp. CPB-2]MDF1494671.1 fluoride efflux transporter CrcB [Caproiciproducens sp. CPB-2]